LQFVIVKKTPLSPYKMRREDAVCDFENFEKGELLQENFVEDK
jgi:hypothetical protein